MTKEHPDHERAKDILASLENVSPASLSLAEICEKVEIKPVPALKLLHHLERIGLVLSVAGISEPTQYSIARMEIRSSDHQRYEDSNAAERAHGPVIADDEYDVPPFSDIAKDDVDDFLSNSVRHSTDDDTDQYLRLIESRYVPLNLDRQMQLIRMAQQGNKLAKQLFVRHNVRLTYPYVKPDERFGKLEQVQAGLRGLLQAAINFDFREGVSFATYAGSWIRRSISRHKADRSSVSLKSKPRKLASRINKAEIAFLQQVGRDPSIEEIAEQTGLAETKIRQIFTWREMNNATSMEEPIAEDATVSEQLSGPKRFHPDNVAQSNEVLELFEELLAYGKLNKQERALLYLRANPSRDPVSYAQIEKLLGISKTTAKRIFESARDKILPVFGPRLKQLRDDNNE